MAAKPIHQLKHLGFAGGNSATALLDCGDGPLVALRVHVFGGKDVRGRQLVLIPQKLRGNCLEELDRLEFIEQAVQIVSGRALLEPFHQIPELGVLSLQLGSAVPHRVGWFLPASELPHHFGKVQA